jgi:PTH1 family peptidyl-tRNA hydrolase
MKLIVGLGNPGKGYAGSRHNIGAMCLERFARQHRIRIKQRRLRLKSLKSTFGSGEVAGVPLVLARPRTYMNVSGAAVAQLVHRFNVPPDDLLVIHDDMDLPLGKLRIRQRGGAGGHKGVSAIIQALGSEEFPRIRIGIGRPAGDEVAFVLGQFSADERAIVEQALKQASEAIYCLLAEGIEPAMNRYN